MPPLYHTPSLFDEIIPAADNRARTSRRSRPPLIRRFLCAICGATKEYDANIRSGGKTCSRECGRLHRIQNYAPPPPPLMKMCRRCGVEKPFNLEHFPPSKAHKSHGLYAYCRACNVAKHKAWTLAHPERAADSRRMYGFNKGARRRKIAGYVSVKILRLLISEHEGRCAYCRQECPDYHIDHIHAVNKGGVHDYENLCIACPSCNYSKNQSSFEEWHVRRPDIDFTWVNNLISRRSLAKNTKMSALT